MTVFARDVSNYSDELTPAVLQAWRDGGTGLVIIQAFPSSYTTKYAEQRRQMDVCAQEGMPFDCYIYDYLGDPTWLDGALAGLEQVLLPSEKPRKVWLDEEDTETEAGWSAQQRINAISNSIGSVKQRGYQCGIYTARWWWVPKTGDFKGFSEYPLWMAQYDGVADSTVITQFGGWQSCRIKQYLGSQPDGTDLNVLSDEEEAELIGGGDEPMADCDTLKAAIERAENRLGLELAKKTALSKKIVREIQSELFQALQS